VAAALAPRSLANIANPRMVRFRLQCLEQMATDVPYVQTATRPINIVSAAHKKGIAFGPTLADVRPADLQSQDGENLLQAALEQDEALMQVTGQPSELADTVSRLRGLASPINQFFESTMIMAEEPDVRYARLTLLNAVAKQLLVAGDWSKIVIEG
jgi:glycyl-tRNA synthetase beta subunit